MRYRVRLDLSFDSETDAQALMDYAKQQLSKAVSLNEGQDNEEISFCDLEQCRHDEEISFCDLEQCRHDEGLPCTKLERVEVRKQVVS